MSNLLPHDLSREPGHHPNEDGTLPTRVFRVTFRDIDERTILVLAHTPEEAASGKASQISSFDRQHIFECTQCIEYRPTDTVYSTLPQTT